MSDAGDDTFGLDHKAGGAHYRAYVGPPADYDLISGLQFTLLFRAGLRETHRLLDVGCGSLRAGRLFIPYLRPGHYYGVEPNGWLIDEGISRELGTDILEVKRPTFSNIRDFSFGSLGALFDFVIAHSILSHTFPDLAARALSGMHDCLDEGGVVIATFLEGDEQSEGSGWLYPGTVPITWSEIQALGEDAGLALRRLSWPHPRQVWFVGSRDEVRAEEIAASVGRGER
jgi:SAM-dependent methyltransferase